MHLKNLEHKGLAATRAGFGEAITKLGEVDSKVCVVCADTTASVQVAEFKKRFPERFINVGIAEQNMIGVSAGLALSGLKPFAVTYSMFASGRAYDQLRNSVAYNDVNVKIIGSHGGISVGPDGATHQIIEEYGLIGNIPRMKLIVPCDKNEAYKATFAINEVQGPVFMRLGREPLPNFTDINEEFVIGKAKKIKDGKDIAILACGNLVWEAIIAAEELEKENISIEVWNHHTLKPVDEEAIITAAKKCGRIITVEEHNIYLGFGALVSRVVCNNYPVFVYNIGVKDVFGESGSCKELFQIFEVDAKAIYKLVKQILKK